MKIPDKSMILTNSEYRPCFVILSHGVHRAIFHRWATKQGLLPSRAQYTTVQALVEYADGSMGSVEPEKIRFIDSKQLFEQFAWGGEKEEQDGKT